MNGLELRRMATVAPPVAAGPDATAICEANEHAL